MTFLIFAAVLVVLTLFAQALAPTFAQRVVLMLVSSGVLAGIALIAGHGGVILDACRAMPHGVLVLIFSLCVFTRILGYSGVFHALSRQMVRMSKGRWQTLALLTAFLMYLLSGVMNNLATMLILLPVILEVLHRLGASTRGAAGLLMVLLPVCNLGGAATPVGDFPALILFGSGEADFGFYLLNAGIACTILFAIFVSIGLWFQRGRWQQPTAARARVDDALAGLLASANQRGGRIRVHVALQVLVLIGMMSAWIASWATPQLVSLVGVGLSVALFFSFGVRPRQLAALDMPWVVHVVDRWIPASSERPLSRAALSTMLDALLTVLFFACLFWLIGVVQGSGLIDQIAAGLTQLSGQSVALRVVLFLVVTSLVTAFFSAGPGMALSLPLTASLVAVGVPKQALYVATALAVCAGSSLLVFSATSGPVLQRGAEALRLGDSDPRLSLSPRDYWRIGVIAYVVTLAGALTYAAIAILPLLQVV